jgi:hypothetical protein
MLPRVHDDELLVHAEPAIGFAVAGSRSAKPRRYAGAIARQGVPCSWGQDPLPSVLLVPSALSGTARNTLGNFGGDPLTLVIEPRLDAATNGATAWYLVGNPNQYPGLEVAFLDGRDRPSVTSAESDSPLGAHYHIVMDVACKFTEHRSWARCKGA